MLKQVRLPSLKEYLTVKDAAAFLGVTPITLRRWDKRGKLKSRRHPINRYRLYKRGELKSLLRKIGRGR